jgi:hypothetical protein
MTSAIDCKEFFEAVEFYQRVRKREKKKKLAKSSSTTLNPEPKIVLLYSTKNPLY